MTEENTDFSIVDSMLSHIRNILDFFKSKHQEGIDDAIISAGRTNEEKEQLREMCEEEDLYEKRLADLRRSNMKPGKWLNAFIDRELDSCRDVISPEAKDLVKQTIMDETGAAIVAQAESLDSEMEQTVDIVRGGKV